MSLPPIRGINTSGDASRIAPKLWQGGFPQDFRDLSATRAAVDVLVLCAVELQPAHDESIEVVRQIGPGANGGPSVEIVRAPLACPGVEVVLCPLEDTAEPSRQAEIYRAALAAAKHVVTALLDGKRVLSTCAQGLNRSGLVTALALIGRHGMSGADAVALVRGKRQNALCNPAFAEFIQKIPAPSQRR